MLFKWNYIPGYKNYQASTGGEIRKVLETDSNGNVARSRILYKHLNKQKGYYQVSIAGKSKTVHRLVALTFIPNPNNLETVDHIDDCKTNNKVTNLQWLSSGDNTRKAFAAGLNIPIHLRAFERAVGSKHGRAKLDERKVIIIKYVLKRKLATQAQLAKFYSVSQSRISEANSGKIWGHVKERIRPIFSYCKTWSELLLVYGS